MNRYVKVVMLVNLLDGHKKALVVTCVIEEGDSQGWKVSMIMEELKGIHFVKIYIGKRLNCWCWIQIKRKKRRMYLSDRKRVCKEIKKFYNLY